MCASHRPSPQSPRAQRAVCVLGEYPRDLDGRKSGRFGSILGKGPQHSAKGARRPITPFLVEKLTFRGGDCGLRGGTGFSGNDSASRRFQPLTHLSNNRWHVSNRIFFLPPMISPPFSGNLRALLARLPSGKEAREFLHAGNTPTRRQSLQEGLSVALVQDSRIQDDHRAAVGGGSNQTTEPLAKFHDRARQAPAIKI